MYDPRLVPNSEATEAAQNRGLILTGKRSATAMALLLLMAAVLLGQGCAAQKLGEKYQEEAGQIYTTVFHKYNSRVRPPDFYPDPVPITVKANLIHIRGFDLLSQELETVLELQIDWQDKRLAWYANLVDTIAVNVKDIWSPSIFYINGVKPPSPLFDSKVVISADGNIEWYRREIVSTLCPTEPQNTTQTCTIILGFTSKDNAEEFDNATCLEVDDDFSNHHWDVEVEFTVYYVKEVHFVLDLVKLDPPTPITGRNASFELEYDARGSASCHVVGMRGVGLLLLAFWALRSCLSAVIDD